MRIIPHVGLAGAGLLELLELEVLVEDVALALAPLRVLVLYDVAVGADLLIVGN